jgi:plasmid rolling circle replication initiator protein Rep
MSDTKENEVRRGGTFGAYVAASEEMAMDMAKEEMKKEHLRNVEFEHVAMMKVGFTKAYMIKMTHDIGY